MGSVRSGSLKKGLRALAARVFYKRIDLLEGFDVLVPRLSRRSAILNYRERDRKIYRFKMTPHELGEFIAILDDFSGHRVEVETVLGRFEFHLAPVGDGFSLAINLMGHDIEASGSFPRLQQGIAQFRASRGLLRSDIRLGVNRLFRRPAAAGNK